VAIRQVGRAGHSPIGSRGTIVFLILLTGPFLREATHQCSECATSSPERSSPGGEESEERFVHPTRFPGNFPSPDVFAFTSVSRPIQGFVCPPLEAMSRSWGCRIVDIGGRGLPPFEETYSLSGCGCSRGILVLGLACHLWPGCAAVQTHSSTNLKGNTLGLVRGEPTRAHPHHPVRYSCPDGRKTACARALFSLLRRSRVTISDTYVYFETKCYHVPPPEPDCVCREGRFPWPTLQCEFTYPANVVRTRGRGFGEPVVDAGPQVSRRPREPLVMSAPLGYRGLIPRILARSLFPPVGRLGTQRWYICSTYTSASDSRRVSHLSTTPTQDPPRIPGDDERANERLVGDSLSGRCLRTHTKAFHKGSGRS